MWRKLVFVVVGWKF